MRHLAFLLLTYLLTALPVLAETHGGGDSGLPWGDILKQAVNFGILVGLLIYFLRKPVSTFLRERRELLIKSMEDAKEAHENAREKLSRVEEKLSRIEEDITRINLSMDGEVEGEMERIKSLTEREIQRIKEQASFTAEQELKQARTELQKEAADLSVAAAKEIISKAVDDEDRKRFIKENVKKIKEVK